MVVSIIEVLISWGCVVSIIEVLISSIIEVLISWGCGGQYYRSVN